LRLRIAFALCCALAAVGQAQTAGAAPAANDAQIIESKRVADRVIELTISTPAFTEPTKVHVDLPVGYAADRSRRWPVTYVTAGTMNNYNTFNNFLDGENLMGDYPSIIVSPDGNSGYWSDWYNSGAFGPPMYETYVIEQLIPLIDDHFRTLADRSHRAIFGISMGGYGALMLAAHNPDLFVAAASLSGAVDSNLPANGAVLSASSTFDGADPDAIYGPRASQEVRWRGHNPWDLAENLRDVDVQVLTANGVPNPAIGEGEGSGDLPSCVVEGGVYMASVSLHDRLNELGLPHLWKDYGPGCHTVPNFTREVLDTLSVFEQVLAAPPARPRRFDYLSIEPHFSVWGWAVRADRARALEFLEIRDAGRRGATFLGSGTTTVKTPPLFRAGQAVAVISAGERRTLKASPRGRLRFKVDLGPAHPNQQYTNASRAAGDGGPGYFTSQTVRFKPRVRAR
jgi:S-formylglutathione hydrolase FrmB